MASVSISASALRYAQAAFAVARESGDYDAWMSALNALSADMERPDLRQALTSPVIQPEEKHAVLEQLGPAMPGFVRNLVNILIDRDRADLIPQVSRAFQDLVNQERGVITAEVTTAIPLDPDTEGTVAQRLGAYLGRDTSRMVIHSRVDPAIIGGVVARVGDTLIDDSVRGRLERLHRVLTG